MKTRRDEQFTRLNQAITLDDKVKSDIKSRVFHVPRKQKIHAVPKLLSGILTVVFIIVLFTFLIHQPTNETSGVITDTKTLEILPEVQGNGSTFTIEWLSDSMDRGNHDLNTNVHGNLVISKEWQPLERGDILYFQMKKDEWIGRVVGLPGETVEIKAGQVYIDRQELQTFYGTATSLGMTEEEYFEKAPSSQVNVEEMKEYFNTSMEPVFVDEETVFVLVDMWWRGIDSRELGPIPYEKIIGKVVGYEK